METYTGKSIFKGIAIGKILFYQKGEQPVKRMKIEDTAEQIKRYEDARAKAAEQLQGLYEKALKEVGEANAAAGSKTAPSELTSSSKLPVSDLSVALPLSILAISST